MVDVYLLPGLDGTGTLFSPFVSAAPKWANPIVLPYENEQSRNYEELALSVTKLIDTKKPHMLLGESFSGPVAILAAVKSTENLSALILSASFVMNPRPLLSLLAPDRLLPSMVRIKPSRFLIKHFLAGSGSSSELLKAVFSTVSSVAPQTIISRFRLVQEVNVSEEFSSLEIPVLYLRARDDRIVPSASSKLIKSLNPGVVVKDLDGPHLLLQNRPREAWKIISEMTGYDC
jgi:pimeloyl-ACP methyl ester carboxylesterase